MLAVAGSGVGGSAYAAAEGYEPSGPDGAVPAPAPRVSTAATDPGSDSDQSRLQDGTGEDCDGTCDGSGDGTCDGTCDGDGTGDGSGGQGAATQNRSEQGRAGEEMSAQSAGAGQDVSAGQGSGGAVQRQDRAQDCDGTCEQSGIQTQAQTQAQAQAQAQAAELRPRPKVREPGAGVGTSGYPNTATARVPAAMPALAVVRGSSDGTGAG